MASIATRANGTREIWIVLADNKRQVIRLGRMLKKDVDAIKTRVEYLVAAKFSGEPLDPATAQWLSERAERAPALVDRLAKLGLVATRPKQAPAPPLATFIDQYIGSRSDINPRTKTNYLQARRLLVEYFTHERSIDTITPADASEWRRWMSITKKLAKNSVRSHAGRAKRFFQYAVDKQLLSVSPFAGMGDVNVKADRKKFRFVTPAEAQRIIDACPSVQWRLLFALARYGGIRVPSEARELQWADVDWENGQILIHSPKTAYQGKEERLLPLFPELRPHLAAAFAEATEQSPGQPLGYMTTLKTIRGQKYGNVGTELKRIIRRAGLEPWPDLLRNLRRTRETELADHFPEHVVAAWIGNSVKVARDHYLRTTDEHFKRAGTMPTAAGIAESAALFGGSALQNALQPDAATSAEISAKSRNALAGNELSRASRQRRAASDLDRQPAKYPRQDSNL